MSGHLIRELVDERGGARGGGVGLVISTGAPGPFRVKLNGSRSVVEPPRVNPDTVATP